MNITSWCFTLKWRRMPKETPHDVLGQMWQEGFLASLIVKTILTLLERIGGALVLYSMCHSIAHWDIMANRFYQTFYIPSPSTSMLGHEMRMEQRKVMLPFQTPSGGSFDKLINAILPKVASDHATKEFIPKRGLHYPLPTRMSSSNINDLVREYRPLGTSQKG